MEAWEIEELVDFLGELVFSESVFGRFLGEVDLEVDLRVEAEFGGDAVDGGGELEGVDGVNDGEVGEGFTDFVALEVANEMPMNVVGEERDFFESFLLSGFAEVAAASGVGGAVISGGPGFGDCKELDVCGVVASFFGGCGDACLGGLNVLSDLVFLVFAKEVVGHDWRMKKIGDGGKDGSFLSDL